MIVHNHQFTPKHNEGRTHFLCALCLEPKIAHFNQNERQFNDFKKNGGLINREVSPRDRAGDTDAEVSLSYATLKNSENGSNTQ